MDLPIAVTASSKLGRTAASALASEADRYPTGKRLLLIGEDLGLIDRLCDQITLDAQRTSTLDSLTIVAPDPLAAVSIRARLAMLPVVAADQVTVLSELPADPQTANADIVLVSTVLSKKPAEVVVALQQYQRFVRPGGVLSVATALTAGTAAIERFLDTESSARLGRDDIVFASMPPLRVHHLRFGTAGPALAETLRPAKRPSHIAVSECCGGKARADTASDADAQRNPGVDSPGIDSNGVAAAGILAGVAAITKLIAPRSKAWLVPALAAVPVAAFFRDPARRTPVDPNLVVAAADGRVLHIERLTDERFGDHEFLRIAVFLSVLDVHINRSPVAGRVVDIVREEGGYAHAGSVDAEHNVAQYTVLETTHGRVVVAQRTGLLARRIVNRARIGGLLSQGERYGLIRFGSRTDVYLPADRATSLVEPGDRIVGGETAIAQWRD